ncbi:MAG TPA: hypothetical protein VK116_01615, partial [Planctomycetota bacterium]|nr:hypothetical protein [Planctomycetota bacterium]
AVHMAAEGANFLMIGRLDMGGELGTHAYEHGREMLAASRLVLDRVFQGQDAQGQNQASMMQIANQARQLIDLLERMPDVGIRR